MKQAVIESYLRRAVINCRESSLSATEIQDLIRMTSAGKSVATRYRSLCRALHNNQRTKPLRSKMTSTTKPITPLCQRMIDDMRMRKLSPKTQASYIRVVKRFSRRPPWSDRRILPAPATYAVIRCAWLITAFRQFH